MTKLDEIMIRLGLSNAELADRLDCKPVEIWRLRVGPQKNGRKMTERWAVRLAPVLNVSPAELLFDRGSDAAFQSEAPRSNLDRYLAVLEGLLEGLGLDKRQAGELAPACLEALELDLDDLEEAADLEARKAVARGSARKIASRRGIQLSGKAPQK